MGTIHLHRDLPTSATTSTSTPPPISKSRSHHNIHDSVHDHGLPLPHNTTRTPAFSSSTSSSSVRSATDSSSAYQSRPRTAPSSHSNSTASNSLTPPAFEPPIPKIAIFADALSLKKLREQYKTIRKSPTLPDLSHADSTRPQSRRINSASATSPVATLPQLPELNFDSKASVRRAPASRSSHGVDTEKGPPPAISTRSSSYTSDVARKAQSPAAAALAQQRDKPYSLRSPTSESFRHASNPFDGLPARDRLAEAPFSPLSPTLMSPDYNRSLDTMMDQRSNYSDAQEYLDESSPKYPSGLSPEQGADTEGSGRSTEDLFLNLAQDSPAPTGGYDASGHLERRLSSRGRNNAHRTSLPTSSMTPKSRRDSVGSLESGARSILPTTERAYSSQRRASTTSSSPIIASNLSRNPSSVQGESRFTTYRNRYVASNTPPQHSARRPSVPDSASMYSRPPAYRPSKLNQYSTRDFDSVSMADSPLDHRTFALRSEHPADGAESVASGAQSTVWDELQELKSRIQRMELVDKMVSTGSNGSNERPKTATTATTPLTTMSSSPKHQFKTGRSPQDSVIGGPAAMNAYPVLHQTLARCKEGLSPQVYRALELATSDALELALLTGNGAAGGGASGAMSVVNGGFTGERQLKRRADNVVRNLQDLCVELCKLSPEPAAAPSSRPGTSNGLPGSSHGLPTVAANRGNIVRAASRASSVEPSTANSNSDTSRAIQSRALDRIEARRASLMSFGNPSATNSPREAPEAFNRNSLQLPSTVDSSPSQQTISKLPRSGTSLLRSRRREGTEEPEDEASPRPVSRAATEIGTLRKRQNRLSGSYAFQRTSREYTSNVPLPNSSPVASPVQPQTPATANTPMRRLNGTSLKNEASPRSASLASSLLREPRRAMTEQTPEPETPTTPGTPAEDDAASGGSRRLLRRSLGMYTSSARASLSLGLGKRSSDRRSIATTAGGE